MVRSGNSTDFTVFELAFPNKVHFQWFTHLIFIAELVSSYRRMILKKALCTTFGETSFKADIVFNPI